LGSFCSAIELHPRGNAFYAPGQVDANAPDGVDPGRGRAAPGPAPPVARADALA
jgi:hypothetical protein